MFNIFPDFDEILNDEIEEEELVPCSVPVEDKKDEEDGSGYDEFIKNLKKKKGEGDSIISNDIGISF